eukprot:15447266-Alexandrium_andersonii.AAC.2
MRPAPRDGWNLEAGGRRGNGGKSLTQSRGDGAQHEGKCAGHGRALCGMPARRAETMMAGYNERPATSASDHDGAQQVWTTHVV